MTDPKIELHVHLEGICSPAEPARLGGPARECYQAGLQGALCDAGTRAALRQRGEQAAWGADVMTAQSEDKADVTRAEPGLAGTNAFGERVTEWIGVLGRIRDVVRQEVLRSQLAGLRQLGHGPARILDVGCGQGTQALHLARAGHDVTGLDSSQELLARFADDLAREPAEVAARVHLIRGPGERAAELVTGTFDLVLCHGVLMYLDDPALMLSALSQVSAPGGAISLLVRNGLAPAMRDGLRGHWEAALYAFDTKEYTNRLGLAAHAHAPADLDRLLAPLGWERQAWFGVRVFTDYLDRPVPEPDELTELLAAEREAGRRDPYRSVAALLHLLYGRVAG